jgi:Tfp pilus assembly protein PilV
MLRTIFSNKGISIVEALVAALLTACAVISLLPMQDTSIRTGFRADYLGRAVGIMQCELEHREHQLMYTGIAPASPFNQIITVSDPINGTSVATGDATFNVVTITTNPVANQWVVNVTVTWAGGPANGITSSILVTRQSKFE